MYSFLRKGIRLIEILLLIIIAFHSDFFSQEIKVEENEIAPSVFHKQTLNEKDNLFINIIKFPVSENYRIISYPASGKLYDRETLSDISKKFIDDSIDVVAGINADFFEWNGEPVNNIIYEGNFVKAVYYEGKDFSGTTKSRTQFAVTKENKPLLERFNLNAFIKFNDSTNFLINRINSKIDSAGITLFNSFQQEIKDESDSITYIKVDSLSSIQNCHKFLLKEFIDEGENLIFSNGINYLGISKEKRETIVSNFSVGDTIKIYISLIPDRGKLLNLTGGMPLIVKNGLNISSSVDSTEGINTKFSETRHPRSGIGFSADSSHIYFITVDGRQMLSRGVSLHEFAEIMIEEGIAFGLNLDGGGSTTMTVREQIVNSPSDATGERPVANVLLLIKTKENNKNPTLDKNK